ncbi:hypothetical protein LV779_34740 [Streptomyces thinghirensis]|nr:hypothetical protein [Streptomyces thinghirensis]
MSPIPSVSVFVVESDGAVHAVIYSQRIGRNRTTWPPRPSTPSTVRAPGPRAWSRTSFAETSTPETGSFQFRRHAAGTPA